MKKSHQIAIAIILVLTIWMSLGMFKEDSGTSQAQANSSNTAFKVEVVNSSAQSMPKIVQAVGHVLPWQQTTLSAEVAGKVAKIHVSDGQRVEKGEVIISLHANDRKAQVEKNKSQLAYQKSRYERSKSLAKKQFQSELDIEQAFADMKSAEADLVKSQLDLENTQIKAPFAGIFESRTVDVGDYLAVNGEVGTLIDNSQLKVVVPISQNAIKNIKVGEVAQVAFATGEQAEGEVMFRSAMANPETRTFKVDIKVDNTDGTILAGSSADVSIVVAESLAHHVSPAILILSDDGVVGVKSVDEKNQVQFHPVNIINSDNNGVWLAGLSEQLRIITVGQAYVKAGAVVEAVVKNNPAVGL